MRARTGYTLKYSAAAGGDGGGEMEVQTHLFLDLGKILAGNNRLERRLCKTRVRGRRNQRQGLLPRFRGVHDPSTVRASVNAELVYLEPIVHVAYREEPGRQPIPHRRPMDQAA